MVSGEVSGGVTPRMLLALCAALTILAVTIFGGGATAFAATPVTVGGKAVVTNTDGDPIRVRRDAGTQFAQIALAYQDQIVEVLAGPHKDATGREWFKVEAPRGTGWMMAAYLEGTGAPAQEARLNGSARVANTNGDPLRMRAAPNAGGRVITLLSPGATVVIHDGPVTDTAGIVWYGVAAKGLTGWAMAQYLVQSETPPAAESAARKEVEATPTPQPKPTAETRGGATSTLEQYRLWMVEARAMYPYPQSIDKMWAVMMCESSGNARASGGGGLWLGIFQYAPGTWGGSWNPYRTASIWDAKSQIFATAKAWSIGMQSHWSCYYKTAGR